MASPYVTFMKTEVPRLKAANPGMDHKVAFKQAAANWKNRDRAERGVEIPTVTIYYGHVSGENPAVEIEKAFGDPLHAYAFTLGKLLAVLCERDPRNLQNSTLINFDRQVRSANPGDYPFLLSRLNDIIGEMGESYESVFGEVRQQQVSPSNAEVLLRDQ
jgi:hypothetical protein